MSAYQDLLAAQESLTDSRQHRETHDAEGRLLSKPFTHRLPGLLEQLYLAAIDPSMAAEAGGMRLKPKSRPPLALEAWSRYTDIEKAALRWVRSLRMEEHTQPGRNIRQLVSAAAGVRGQYLAWDEDTIEALLTEVRQWRRWCAVLTGWESAPWRPYIKCPVCSEISAIWVNEAERSAYCSSCKADWDDVEELAEKVAA
jgi:hypothetical protein